MEQADNSLCTLFLSFCPMDKVEDGTLISSQSFYAFCSMRTPFLEHFLNVFNQQLIIFLGTWPTASTDIISLCYLGPAALEHKLHCFSTPWIRNECAGDRRPDLMGTSPPTNSSISFAHFPFCPRTNATFFNSVLGNTKVHSPHSCNIFCRKSFVESYS